MLHIGLPSCLGNPIILSCYRASIILTLGFVLRSRLCAFSSSLIFLLSGGRPTLTANARSINPRESSVAQPRYFPMACLSTVTICSSRIMDCLGNPDWELITTWVGWRSFLISEVIAATITVGACRLPVSFCSTIAGRMPCTAGVLIPKSCYGMSLTPTLAMSSSVSCTGILNEKAGANTPRHCPGMLVPAKLLLVWLV